MASTHDDIFGKYKLYSGIAIGGVLLALILDSCSGGPEDEIVAESNNQTAPVAQTAAAPADNNTVEKNLEPVEKLAVVDKSAPPAPARSGEEVYQAACMACHAAGVLEAPKLEPGAWDGRVEKGMDGLLHSAINGLNAMPARGGNPAVTDEELSNAISYMLSTAGYQLAAGDSAPAQQAAPADSGSTEATETAQAEAAAVTQTAMTGGEAPAKPAAPEPPAAPQPPASQQAMQSDSQKYIKEGGLGKQVYQNVCFTCHDVGIAQAPVIGDTAAWQQRATAGIDALYNSSLNGKGVMPAKGGNASLSKEQVMAAVDYILETAGVSAAEATTPAAPAQDSAKAAAPAEETAAPAEQPAEVAVAPAAAQSSIDGEKIYRSLCFSCHDGGIAGAPMLGDKAAWEPRIAAGTESLYNNSLNGKGVMPAKGGNPALSDDEIKAAVDWMVQQSQ
ncbi:MAG: c-type cytochrome [Thiolinea sp.]